MQQAALALVLAAWAWAAGAAPADRLCPQAAPAAAPVETTLPGCRAAWCTAVGAQQMCNCQRGDRWWAQRRAGGQVLQQWRAEVSPLMGAGAFEVSLAELDGSGQPHWLVAQFLSQSNGLGVTRHRLCVLWPQAPHQAPLCRDTEEWRVLTLLVQEPGLPNCSLLNAGWQPGREPGRGEGTYAVGRLLRLDSGRWVAAAGRPPVSRRLVQDFMDERETLPQRNAERLWYQHPQAREGRPAGR